MAKQAKAQTGHRGYPEFFLDTPPNHNPVIGATSEDTLRNILDTLKLIEELLLSCEQQFV